MWTYAWVVLADGSQDIRAAVSEVMDNYFDEICLQFWCIGGAWTGIIDDPSPYDEPANFSVCSHCEGSGVRASITGAATTCPVCGGRGGIMKDPSEWVTPPLDYRSTTSLDPATVQVPYTVFTPDGRVEARDLRYFVPATWRDQRAYEHISLMRGHIPADKIIKWYDPALDPEVETYEEVKDRWLSQLRDILARYPNGLVVVIACRS